MNTILIIDTDVSFRDRLNKKLEEDGITDRYRLHLVIPDTTLDVPYLVQACLKSVSDSLFNEEDVIGIFVDIVIIEGGGRSLDSTGIKIAAQLRKTYPSLPILNITGKYSDEESDTDIISEATLEDLDGVLLKSYLVGKHFSAKRLRLIFEKARLRRSRAQELSSPTPSNDVPREVQSAFNVSANDPRVTSEINQIGPIEFWSLLRRLLPAAEGSLSFMQPGRSGALVFRVYAKFIQDIRSPTRPKTWIVKVSSQVADVERELANYREMAKTPFPRAFYPKVLNDTFVTVGSLAGFVLELEDGALSLAEGFADLSETDVQSVSSGISRFVADTYGDPEKRIVKSWNRFYSLDDNATLRISLTLQRYRKLFEEFDKAKLNRVLGFVRSGGVTEESLLNHEQETDLRTVHGDFNVGNLLVTATKQLVIIDFSSRRQDHVARDIAKLERDIVFRVCDGPIQHYYDWSRIHQWQVFSVLNQRGEMFAKEIPDPVPLELQKSISFIQELRRIIKAESPQLTETEYLMALLHYSLLAIGHPDISLQKKVFAISYIDNILNMFESH
jgi:uncharacterized protein associated with vWA-MoxR-VMAP ternary system